MNPHSSTRSKRIGTDSTPLDAIEGFRPSTKRARFDRRNPSTLAPDSIGEEREIEEEVDAILELDEIGKNGQQSKRNAVRLDGYESDSSDENFDSRADAKAAATRRSQQNGPKSQDEEQNDMFADIDQNQANGNEDEDENLHQRAKKSKEMKFLNENEIEGQVASSRSGGHVSANFSIDKTVSKGDASDTESSDASADDYTRAALDDKIDQELGAGSKKHNAPKLDAFNMQNEAEEGKFDESGNFVRRAADPYAVHDVWLEDSSKADMKRAKEAQTRRKEERRRRDIADDAISICSLLSVLIRNLENGETVLEAIARLGRSQPKRRPKWQRNKRREEPDSHSSSKHAVLGAAHTTRAAIEEITEAADQLLARGQPDIYDAERGLLMRQFQRERGEEWQGDATNMENSIQNPVRKWEYRWTDGRDEGRTYGPYDSITMQSWTQAGYFGEGVEFKEVGSSTGDWISLVEFN